MNHRAWTRRSKTVRPGGKTPRTGATCRSIHRSGLKIALPAYRRAASTPAAAAWRIMDPIPPGGRSGPAPLPKAQRP